MRALRAVILTIVAVVALPASLLAGNASLTVTSTPSGANVTVDGMNAGITPVTVSLNAGMHSVMVFIPNSNWATAIRVVNVAKGKNNLTVLLQPSGGDMQGPPGPPGPQGPAG